MATEKRATEQEVQRHAARATAHDEATLRATEDEIALKEAELLEAKESAEERASVLAAEAEAAREATRAESERRRQAEERAASKVAELEEARRVAEEDAAQMASKARKIAEIARQEVSQARVERKLLEQTTAKRLAEIEAERMASERAAHKQAQALEVTDIAERRRAAKLARKERGQRAREEAEMLIEQRAVDAAAKLEAEENARIEEANATAKQAHREEWTRRLRNVGNVAASVGIIAIAAAGADRIVGWSGSRSNDDARDNTADTRAATRNTTPAESGDRDPIVDSLMILPPAIELDTAELDLSEVGVAPLELDATASDPLATVVRNAIDVYGITAEEHGLGEKSCSDLQSAFVDVDTSWLEYSMKRAGELADANRELDANRDARDGELSVLVREVEAAFAATGCPRP